RERRSLRAGCGRNFGRRRVTHRQEEERAMNDTTADATLWRTLVEQSPDAVVFADPEGIVRVWNGRAEALFGYTAGEAIGRSLDIIIPEHLRERHWQGYRRAIAEGHTRPDA